MYVEQDREAEAALAVDRGTYFTYEPGSGLSGRTAYGKTRSAIGRTSERPQERFVEASSVPCAGLAASSSHATSKYNPDPVKARSEPASEIGEDLEARRSKVLRILSAPSAVWFPARRSRKCRKLSRGSTAVSVGPESIKMQGGTRPGPSPTPQAVLRQGGRTGNWKATVAGSPERAIGCTNRSFRRHASECRKRDALPSHDPCHAHV
ncbi:hypothetical protein KM043_002734 [Ampulex compressa]|nr:hypothetical protein KM043_002734 [Ampulex compressa]